MFSRKKIILIVILAMIGSVLLSWGIAYGFAASWIKLAPHNPPLVANSRPILSANLPILGARLLSAKVTVDGEDVSNQLKLNSKGFTYLPREALPEGRHLVRATLFYRFVFRRKLEISWVFTTDTIPPHLTFFDHDKMIAVRSSWVVGIRGETEPRSTLKVALNGYPAKSPQVKSNGRFTLDLYRVKNRNQLVIRAVDKAGNRSVFKIPVVVDTRAPQIASLSPGPNQIKTGDAPRLRVKLEEPDSYIALVKLTIDDRPVNCELLDQARKVVYESTVLKDGEHVAWLQVADGAGNKLEKKWSFKVDSTRVVLKLSERRIYLYKRGQLFKTYPVAIGQEARFPTPMGHYEIISKRKNPTWYNPHMPWSADMPEKIPPGPGNPLGTRALNLNAPGIRIHGTYSSGSIGSAASHGCIRMYIHDAEELFDLVSVGTPVDIIQ